jgi:hypothetical protein
MHINISIRNDMNIKQDLALQIAVRGEVVQHEPDVANLAEHFGFFPATLFAKINEFLLTPVERRLYLIFATNMSDSNIMEPRTFGRIVRSFTGPTSSLGADSLIDHEVGQNLQVSQVDQFIDFLDPVMELIRGEEWSLDVDSACELVRCFGDDAVAFVHDIDHNLDGVLEAIKIRSSKESKKLERAVKYIVCQMLPEIERTGRPMPRTVSELFDDSLADKLKNMDGYKDDKEIDDRFGVREEF